MGCFNQVVLRFGAGAMSAAGIAACRAVVAAGLLGALILTEIGPSATNAAETPAGEATPIKGRHVAVSRTQAAHAPRSEGDQIIVDDWPIYRTERGQGAFNDAMATLHATRGVAPGSAAFKGCQDLDCKLALPSMDADGWLPPGRLWVSASAYILIAHSPRPQSSGSQRSARSFRRHAFRSMRYFVFHEFHNGSRNTDTFDTISSHSGSVYVPLYMSKQGTDAQGHQFVVVLQVAPYDVVSIHATSYSSAGPGIEVAKNVSDTLEPLQGLAGIVVATFLKSAAPHLKVVNHRGTEGLPMLHGYERRLTKLQSQPNGPEVALPFIAAPLQRVAMADSRLGDLILRPGASPQVPVADRGFMPPKTAALPAATIIRASAAAPGPQLLEPVRPAFRPGSEPVLIGPIVRAVRPACAKAGQAVPISGCGRGVATGP